MKNSKSPTVNWKLLLAAAVVLCVAAYYVFFRTPATASLPLQLAGLVRTELVEGERANDILDRMHEKEVSPSVNAIGVYAGGNGHAVIYLSIYHSENDARRAYRNMARSIEEGNLLFSDYRRERVGNREVSFCTGQGQDHYFFTSKKSLYWLAADAPLAETAARELIAGL